MNRCILQVTHLMMMTVRLELLTRGNTVVRFVAVDEVVVGEGQDFFFSQGLVITE